MSLLSNKNEKELPAEQIEETAKIEESIAKDWETITDQPELSIKPTDSEKAIRVTCFKPAKPTPAEQTTAKTHDSEKTVTVKIPTSNLTASIPTPLETEEAETSAIKPIQIPDPANHQTHDFFTPQNPVEEPEVVTNTGGKMKFVAIALCLVVLAAAITFGVLTLLNPNDEYATLRKGLNKQPLWSAEVPIQVDGDAQNFPPYALQIGDSNRLGIVLPKEKGAQLIAVDVATGKPSNFYYQGKEVNQVDLEPCNENLVTKQPYYFDSTQLVCVLPSSQLDVKPEGLSDDGQTVKSAGETKGNLFYQDETLRLIAFPNQIATTRIDAIAMKDGQPGKTLWSLSKDSENTVGSDGYHIWFISQGKQKDKPILSYFTPQK